VDAIISLYLDSNGRMGRDSLHAKDTENHLPAWCMRLLLLDLACADGTEVALRVDGLGSAQNRVTLAQERSLHYDDDTVSILHDTDDRRDSLDRTASSMS
jgi:hypothetical protein